MAGRIGIEGPAGGGLAALNRMGCSLGAVSWRPGVFVPEYIGPGRILERRPIGSNALSINHTFPCIWHGASERLLPSPARPRRICAFAPPAGSNSPTRHVENCGRPAGGLDSTGARSAVSGGCMTAADGKRGHRFRTNLANRATRHGEAGSSTAGTIRAVRGGVTSSGIAATLFYNPRRPRCSIPSHRTVTPTISTRISQVTASPDA